MLDSHFNKVADWRPATLIKKGIRQRYFHAKFETFSDNFFFMIWQSISDWLLLKITFFENIKKGFESPQFLKNLKFNRLNTLNTNTNQNL